MKTPLNCLVLAFAGTVTLGATIVSAQEQTRTRSYEGPNLSGTVTTTVNPETGTATRDRTATNRNTGNSATSNAVRQRSDSGSTLNVVQTGPRGNSRTLSGERVREGGQSSFTGTATGRGGQAYGLEGQRSRDGRGNFSTTQSVTNSAGETVATRQRSRSVNNGEVSRSVSRSGNRVANRSRARRPR